MTAKDRIRNWLMLNDKAWAVITLPGLLVKDPKLAGLAICERHNIDISGLSTEDAVIAHIANELEKL